MPVEAAHQKGWQIFEVIVGVPYLLAVALQWVVPLSLPAILLEPLGRLIAVIMIGIGVGIVASARREMARHGQPTDPGRPTLTLVTSGVFSISRNPLYLGGILTLVGLAWAFDLAWALIVLAPALIACQILLIGPEEAYLAERFGDSYRHYAATVHRWLGRARSI